MMHNDYSHGASVSVASVDAPMLGKIEKGQIFVNFYTHVLVLKGKLSCRLKGDVIELGENDLVLVPPNYPISYDSYTEDLQAINLMVEEDKKYLLVGPGRWGTRDQFLGIPVTWPQISNAKVIVEMSLPGFPLDSSLGSHFFHNVTSMNIGYFSIQDSSTVDFINWDYIKKQKPVHETEFFRHVSLKSPMKIKMNGRERKAHVLRDKD